jgi:hypothetical protein
MASQGGNTGGDHMDRQETKDWTAAGLALCITTHLVGINWNLMITIVIKGSIPNDLRFLPLGLTS